MVKLIVSSLHELKIVNLQEYFIMNFVTKFRGNEAHSHLSSIAKSRLCGDLIWIIRIFGEGSEWDTDLTSARLAQFAILI